MTVMGIKKHYVIHHYYTNTTQLLLFFSFCCKDVSEESSLHMCYIKLPDLSKAAIICVL